MKRMCLLLIVSLLLIIGVVNAEKKEYNKVELRNGYRYAKDWYKAQNLFRQDQLLINNV